MIIFTNLIIFCKIVFSNCSSFKTVLTDSLFLIIVPWFDRLSMILENGFQFSHRIASTKSVPSPVYVSNLPMTSAHDRKKLCNLGGRRLKLICTGVMAKSLLRQWFLLITHHNNHNWFSNFGFSQTDFTYTCPTNCYWLLLTRRVHCRSTFLAFYKHGELSIYFWLVVNSQLSEDRCSTTWIQSWSNFHLHERTIIISTLGVYIFFP